MMKANIQWDGTPGSQIGTGDLANAARVLARLLGSPDPLDREEAAEYVTRLSRVPGGQFVDHSCDPDWFLNEWNEIRELFAGLPETIPLVESVYKEWTIDKGHPLAGRKGLVYGDPAAHMTEVLESFGMTPDPEDPLPADHLAVLLEFLAYSIEALPWQDVDAFCKDHLDWLADLRKEAEARQTGEMLVRLILTAERLIDSIISRHIFGDVS
jgi:hypothetical protein